MKVTTVAVDVVRGPVDRPYLAGGRTVDANWHVLAPITTSDGVQGIGYIVYPRPDLMTVIAGAARELGEQLVGAHVLETEANWDRLARRGDWVLRVDAQELAPHVLVVERVVFERDERVAGRVLPLDIGRPPAVLEVVDPPVAHEGILDTAEINPYM